ncbi:MAG: twin-arginine translocase subunit TatC [Aquisalinus sp.]|nr:twin-arginine translocase subunit TatC [Aquisalinus sp.]
MTSKDTAVSASQHKNQDIPPDIIPDETSRESVDEVEASRAPLMSHLIELRRRLIVCLITIGVAFGICFIFSQALYDLLTVPYIEAVKDKTGGAAELEYRPLELFFARVKLALMAAVMVAFPIIARELYAFVAPGLYKNEKQAVLPFLLAIPVLFGLGLALVYFMIMPFVINFALGMERPLEEGQELAYNLIVFVGDYLSLIMTLMIAFGFAFQLPVILTLLAMAGIVDAGFLQRNRRFAIVGIFLVAAFLTPPDPISQIALGLTIWVLYEISILAVKVAAKRSDPEEEAG